MMRIYPGGINLMIHSWAPEILVVENLANHLVSCNHGNLHCVFNGMPSSKIYQSMLIRFSTNCAVQCPVQESWSHIGDTVLHNALALLRPNTVCIVNVNYKAHRVQVTTVPVKIMKGEAPNGLVHGYQSRRCVVLKKGDGMAEGTRLWLPIPLSLAEAQVASWLHCQWPALGWWQSQSHWGLACLDWHFGTLKHWPEGCSITLSGGQMTGARHQWRCHAGSQQG